MCVGAHPFHWLGGQPSALQLRKYLQWGNSKSDGCVSPAWSEVSGSWWISRVNININLKLNAEIVTSNHSALWAVIKKDWIGEHLQSFVQILRFIFKHHLCYSLVKWPENLWLFLGQFTLFNVLHSCILVSPHRWCPTTKIRCRKLFCIHICCFSDLNVYFKDIF